MVKKFSIIIPNWNGKQILEGNLPEVLATGAQEVIIVDNGSTDGSIEFLENLEKEGKIRLISLKKNFGFVYACNLGVKQAENELIILLNNDVIPSKDFLKPLRTHFKKKNVFAVSLNELQWSWACGQWEKGFVNHFPGNHAKKAHISFWASGGSGAFNKKIWDQLGGFDSLFHPFYWEDVDLSYRAWKRGFKIIWEPKAVVYHEHEGTIGPKFSKRYIELISKRNQLLFIWKNITDLKMTLEHKGYLFLKLLTKPGWWLPFLAALSKLPKILFKRLIEIKQAQVTDRQVFRKFK